MTRFEEQLDADQNGRILCVDKPEGWTSFDAVKKIRKQLRVKKIGHAGTLDPFATGLLLVCTGRATKQVEKLMELEKEYIGEIELGKVTDTYDKTGKILATHDTSHVQLGDVTRVCWSFQGDLLQKPPMYSAVKINGERLYKLARQGKTVARQPRKVKVYEIEILDFKNPIIELRIVCSRGTYVRSIAHDIGEKLGCGAHLKSLVRTRIGSYRLQNAHSISDLIQTYENTFES
ncbi:tRNA pseudouridine(55) synthase TruB [candidate division KSB1 bacterium]|nr:tRNA pseudouridine(55) synthase TruB [candidate division KSB1 bacterium]NIR70417.1 tRNA pseudouridine(55) synthase TruB [candidate division KSB1 bacterium]NIS25957.1 tRNA pseudouridine(55) synthase TruB [candidate division KSB1 bacterium]NIT69980.1 tRNA pseudouridine(55) synthase TruB [candidate division KSB1 bacterium]NIU26645.1 tRNA pseudouridine(55) synthase TruB [candidate division KSB1 bacterium]